MAQELIGFKIQIEGQEKVVNTIGEMKDLLMEANAELVKAEDNFGQYSKEAETAAKKVNEIKTAVEQATGKKITFDSKQASQAFSDIKEKINKANIELDNAKTNFGEYSKEAIDAKAKIDELNQSVSELSDKSIKLDGDTATKSVGSIKQQLKEANLELIKAQQEFGDYSAEAIAAAKKVAGLKDAVQEAAETAQLFDPGKKFQAFAGALSAAAGGIAAVQGAIGLVGEESEDLQKTLVKVQSALALSQGLSAITDSAKDFARLKVVVVDAFKAIRLAIGSTGIGAIVIAVGALVAYWDEIKAAVSGVSEEQNELNKKTQANLETEKEKLNAIGGQENILKLQGKSEKEILDIKIKQTDQVIAATEESIKQQQITLKGQIEASKRNKEILEGILKFLTVPITALLKAVDYVGKALGKDFGLEEKVFGGIAKLVFDPKGVEEEGQKTIKELDNQLLQLKNQRAGFQLSIQNINKQASDKAAEQRKKDFDKELEDEKKRQERLRELQQITEEANFERKKERNEIDKNIDASFAKEKEQLALTQLNSFQFKVDELRLLNLQNLQNDVTKEIEIRQFAIQEQQRINEENYNKGIVDRNAYLARKKELDNAEMALDEEVYQNKVQLAQSASGVLSGLSELAGRDTAAGKALAIAQATIDTFTSASTIFRQAAKNPITIANPAYPYLMAAPAVLSGIARVKQIASIKIPGGGGVATQAIGQPANAPIAPAAPLVNTRTQLDSTTIQEMGNVTNRAYVIESDVTNSQERIRRINRAARLG